MTILLLDDDYVIIEQLKCLTQLDNGWRLITPSEIEHYDTIDLVIVDIFKNKYNKILEKILKEDPKIKTLVVSTKLSKKLDKECEYCINNFKRIRLIKPIKLKLLYDTINEFDSISACPMKDAFEHLDKLIPIIIKQFKNLLYDQETKTITTQTNEESKEHTMQVLGLLTLLDQNEINYTLLNANAIKIHI